MKPMLLTLIVFLSALAPVAALTSTLEETYAPGASMIARLEGGLLTPIQQGQVELRRGHVPVPFDHEVGQLDTVTYVAGIAPRGAGNYTLTIRDVRELREGIATTTNYTHAFSVAGALAPYAVRPGFVNSEEDFTIAVLSNQETAQTITVVAPAPREVVLQPGTTMVEISAASLPVNTLMSISIGMYKIPVFIRGNNSFSQPGAATAVWIVDPPRLSAEIRRGDAFPAWSVSAAYRGTRELKNVALQHNASLVRITPASFKSIKPNESVAFNVSIQANSNASFSDVIAFGTGNESFSLPVVLDILPVSDERTNGENASGNKSLEYCSQLSGIVCRAGDTCSATPIASRDGACCLGVCEAPAKKSNAWIGYLLFGIILLVVAIAWARYKRVRPRESALEKEAREKHPYEKHP